MKKLFVSIICIVFLGFGSVASADMFTSTVDFYGIGVYANHDNQPAFGPFYGVGLVGYAAVWDFPDDPTKTYTWSLGYDYEVFAKYTYGDEWMEYNFSNSGSIPLGEFALNEPGNPVESAKNFIEALPSSYYLPGLGGYIHFGGWDQGIVLLGLSSPLGELEKAIGGFEGELQLTATDASPIPEPATMLLFGTGLVGLAGLGIRKIK